MPRVPQKQPSFVTDRLRLRPFRTSDVKTMHALYGDADNLRYWSTPPSPDLASTRRVLRWHKAVGMINYHRRDLRERRVDVGWLLLPASHGRGYMARPAERCCQLFDDLDVHRAAIIGRSTASGTASCFTASSPERRCRRLDRINQSWK